MYDIGILGESLFLNDISRQPMILAQALLNPNISVEDANTLADFILFRLYHPCIINASSLTKVFFQRLLFEIEAGASRDSPLELLGCVQRAAERH